MIMANNESTAWVRSTEHLPENGQPVMVCSTAQRKTIYGSMKQIPTENPYFSGADHEGMIHVIPVADHVFWRTIELPDLSKEG